VWRALRSAPRQAAASSALMRFDVAEAQRSFGAYPDYAPYPMAHGGGVVACG